MHGSARRFGRLAAAGLVALIGLTAASPAHALPSDAKLGCLTGATAVGPLPGGSGACATLPSATAAGNGTPLSFPSSPVMPADGKHLYVISESGVTTFTRNAGTGGLTFAGCISGDSTATGCATTPGATAGGSDSGLSGLQDLVVSPDGRNLYAAAASDDAIVTFSRNPTTGALSFGACVTGESAGTPCTPLGTATATGEASGLDGARGIAIAPDGRFVAATAPGDDAVILFGRDPASGSLSPLGCGTGAAQLGPPPGADVCGAVDGRVTPDAVGTGFDGVGGIAFSPDGLNLYVTAQSDDAITTLDRDDPSSENFEFTQCYTGNTGRFATHPCTPTPGATADGNGSELDLPTDLVVPDAFDVLVTSARSDAVTTFGRPAGFDGALSFTGCVSSSSALAASPPSPCAMTSVVGSHSPLSIPGALAVTPDGATVLSSAATLFGPDGAQALTTLTRNLTDGSIAFTRCLAGDTSAGPAGTGACSLIPSAQPGGPLSGLMTPAGIVVSPDNRHAYVTSLLDAAITWFGNDGDGDTVGDDLDNCPGAANATQADADGDGIGDVCDPTPNPVVTPTPPPPAAPFVPAVPPAPPPAAAAPAPTAAPPFPAKLKVRRAGVPRKSGRRVLDVLAEITNRGNGEKVAVSYRSSGRTTKLTETVEDGRIRISERLSSEQPKNTGIFTLSFPGADGVRRDEVRLRAAGQKAKLEREELRIVAKKLRVSGTISKRAKGVVRIRMDYSDAKGNPETETFTAKIRDGEWQALHGLPPDARDGGFVTILFTGFEGAKGGPMRGEQDAKAVGVGR